LKRLLQNLGQLEEGEPPDRDENNNKNNKMYKSIKEINTFMIYIKINYCFLK
jgi:hypothetical protein